MTAIKDIFLNVPKVKVSAQSTKEIKHSFRSRSQNCQILCFISFFQFKPKEWVAVAQE